MKKLKVVALALCVASAAAPLAAQAPRVAALSPSLRRAIESISEADMRRRIAVLADDSMRGRYTPSPELEQVAAYIAGEFRRFGLRPAGDSAGFLQRYDISRTALDSSRSFLVLSGEGSRSRWVFGREARLLAGSAVPAVGAGVAGGGLAGPIVLVVGAPESATVAFEPASLAGAVVLQVAALGPRGLEVSPVAVARAARAGAVAWVAVSNRPADQFRALAAGSLRPQSENPGRSRLSPIPVIEVNDSVAAPFFAAQGVDVAALRAASTPAGARRLGGARAELSLARRVIERQSAPNVVGVLEGSDPALRNEYVLFSAHMDHVGVGAPVRGDSVYNGADDDASGTAAVVELAEAFAQLSPRPRRSLVFLTVSGEERGLWGSAYYGEHPAVRLAATVAALNIDMIGRNWRDTVVVIGKEHSTLGEVANRVSREHPELLMRLIDDPWPQENFYYRSDHYNFARKGVPILFFFSGVHPDYHRPSDTVDKIDAEKAARIVRMVFYVGLEVASAAQRPVWDAASRRAIVEGSR